MSDQLAFAFIAGTVATVNPCGFALLPAYLAGRLRTQGGPPARGAVVRALAAGAVTTAGFLVAFGTIGSAISLGAWSLTRVVPWAALAVGALLVLAGLAGLSGRRVGLRLPTPLGKRPEASGYASLFLFGVGYGVASLSCTLPVFLSVAGVTFTGDVATGALMFVAYAAGMGTILTALAVAAALSRAGLALAARRLLPYANRLGGALLVAAGAYVVYYWTFFLTPGSETRRAGRAPIDALTAFSTAIRAWLSQGAGQTAALLLLAGLAAAVAGLIARRLRAPARRGERADIDEGTAGPGIAAPDRRG